MTDDKKLTKYDSNLLHGMNKRKTDFGMLNTNLPTEAQFRPIHLESKIMTLSEKKKNNTANNRAERDTGVEFAMGLDWELVGYGKVIPFRAVCLKKKGGNGVYLKIPYTYTNRDKSNNLNEKDYLAYLISKMFHIIAFNEDGTRVSGPIPINTFIKYWHPRMLTSKGNRNRLQFHGPVRKIGIRGVHERNIFGTPIDELLELLKK